MLLIIALLVENENIYKSCEYRSGIITNMNSSRVWYLEKTGKMEEVEKDGGNSAEIN